MSESGFICLKNLSKNYPEGNKQRVVLQDINAVFQQGDFVSIVGKSGSGKSTLLNLISGIDRPDNGSIYLNGTDLTRLNDHDRTIFRRQNIGFVFQFFNLIPTLTVLENITLPLELNAVSQKTARTRGEALLDVIGLLDRAGAYPDRLSGGEQQRVAIARALIHDPLLLLADEPTGNLDEETGKQVLGLLDRLTRQAGKNLILVTHNLEAASYSDRVYRLQNGNLT